MAAVTITLEDTPSGTVAVHSDFKPAIGSPCSLAQSAALEIMNRTASEYGLPPQAAPTFHQTTGHVDAISAQGNGARRFYPLEGAKQ